MARGPIDAGRGERGLDAKDVFRALIEAFQLKAPSLTSDPLGFFAGHLRASLPDSSDQGVDIYFIPKVIEKIERAMDLERAASEPGPTEAALERVLEAVRSSRYGDVIAAARTLVDKLNDLGEKQLRDLIDAVWSAAVGLYDNSQEEMDGYDMVVAIGDVLLKRGRDNPALRERMAKALLNKGLTLDALNRSEEAVAVYDEVVKRFGDATEPALREQVATALVNKGLTLDALNRGEEAVAVYDEVVKRFGDATEPALREQVGTALNDIGFRFLSDAKRMLAAGDESAARDRLLGAEEKLRAGLDREPDGPVILGNLGYAVFLSGRLDEARELLARAIRIGGEKLRQAELDDAAIHPLPQDETFKELVRSIPGPESEVEEK